MTGMQPQNRCLGYARVSIYGQTLDAQLEQLRGAGCTKIYREKVTGGPGAATAQRFARLLRAGVAGDPLPIFVDL